MCQRIHIKRFKFNSWRKMFTFVLSNLLGVKPGFSHDSELNATICLVPKPLLGGNMANAHFDGSQTHSSNSCSLWREVWRNFRKISRGRKNTSTLGAWSMSSWSSSKLNGLHTAMGTCPALLPGRWTADDTTWNFTWLQGDLWECHCPWEPCCPLRLPWLVWQLKWHLYWANTNEGGQVRSVLSRGRMRNIDSGHKCRDQTLNHFSDVNQQMKEGVKKHGHLHKDLGKTRKREAGRTNSDIDHGGEVQGTRSMKRGFP